MEEEHLKLTKATSSDDQELIQFFAESELPGPIHLNFERKESFFNYYRLQSDDSSTYILRNKMGNIEATASLVFREGVIDGQIQSIGYATDLRVLPTRGAIFGWSEHFLPVMEAERLARNCKYIFSVVSDSQQQAYNAFIRPRSVRRVMPRYHLFRKFQLISLHGLWPFHTAPLKGIVVRHASNADLEKLSEYIYFQSSRRPLHFFPTPEAFEHNLERWKGLNLQDFLIAFDRTERIIGCVAPWSPSSVQKITVRGYDANTKNLQDILRLLSVFKVAHPLAKEGTELHLKHLTHLQADNPDILYSLLYHAYRESNPTDILLYPHFEGELHTNPPTGD